ncbi:MAG TPA: tetratricopeptide repeat protein [Drouetiella sp.]
MIYFRQIVVFSSLSFSICLLAFNCSSAPASAPNAVQVKLAQSLQVESPGCPSPIDASSTNASPINASPVIASPVIASSLNVSPINAAPINVSHKTDGDSNWQDLYQRGQDLYSAGHYDEAYAVWKTSLEAADRDKNWQSIQSNSNGLSASCRIDLLKKLALMHKTQNQPALAIEKYNQALATAIANQGANSQCVADLMLEQGRMYTFNDQTQNFSKANELFEEAYRINKDLHGEMSIPAGDVAIAIAQLKEKENNFAEALGYWQTAVAIGNKLEPGTISCCRIGPRQGTTRCLEALNKNAECENAYKDLIEMCKAGAPSMLPTVESAHSSFLLKTSGAH